MSPQQWLVYIICWIAGLACGSMASAVPTYLPEIARDMTAGGVDVAALGTTVQSMFLAGWVCGGILLGLVADLRGRAPVIGVSVISAVLLTAATPYVDSPLALGVIRLLTGLFIGATMAVSTTLGAELLPDRWRPVMMGVLANSYAAGVVCSGALQANRIPYEDVAGMVALFSIPALLFFLPSLRHRQHAPSKRAGESIAVGLGRSKREIVIGSLLFGSMLIVLWSAFSWLPTWASQSFPGSDGGAGLRGSVMLALGGGAIVGSLLVGPLVALVGRVRGAIVCYVGVAIGCVLLYGSQPSSPVVFMTLVGAMAIFFGLSQALMSFYIPELFPRAVRATCVGLCFNLGRSITAVAVLQVGVIAQLFGGFREALFATSAVLIVGLVAALRASNVSTLRND